MAADPPLKRSGLGTALRRSFSGRGWPLRVRLGTLKRKALLRVGRLTGGSIAIGVGSGVRVWVPARDELASELGLKSFEHRERDFVERALRPGDVFFDIGAHVGLFALVAARRVEPTGGSVYACEPNPRTFRLLERNVVKNGLSGRVVCIQVALGEKPGTEVLHVPDARFSAWASLGLPTKGRTEKELEVSVSTLDDLARGSPRPFMVKIDVEGWERRVLDGGHALLSPATAPHLLVEFTDLAALNAGSSTAELYERLVALGYGLYRYDESGRLAPEPFRGSYPYDNLVATKRRDELTARLAVP